MIQPKKSLGQHFLTDHEYCKRIIELAEINRLDSILEIGSGTGLLTSSLLRHGGRVYALEFDRDMVAILLDKFQKEMGENPPRFSLQQGNVLALDWKPLLLSLSGSSVPERPKIVGNLPYNISTRILEHASRFKSLYQHFTFMSQKEVARRILAEPGSPDYGYFSVLMDFHFQRISGFDVPPGAFSPPPKVISHVMQLKPRYLEVESEKRFIGLVKIAFSQRRKTIYNNLKSYFPDRGLLSEILRSSGIAENARPQEISLSQFLAVSDSCRGVISFRP